MILVHSKGKDIALFQAIIVQVLWEHYPRDLDFAEGL